MVRLVSGIAGLVSAADVDPDLLVPATPKWSVHDVVAMCRHRGRRHQAATWRVRRATSGRLPR